MVGPDLDSTDIAKPWEQIEIYLSSNTLKITDYYSWLINAHDTKPLKAADTTERWFKLDSYKQSTGTEYPIDELAPLFSNLCEGNQVEDWEIMLLICNEKNHIIQCIVDGCASLWNHKEYEKVALILSRSWLKALAPLVVLLTWAQCSNFSETVMLLKNLVVLGTEINYLTPACKKLVYQNKLIEWCMDKVMTFLNLYENSESMLNELFKRLKSSCVLYALNDTRLITILKFDEVTDLLENQPSCTDNIQRHKISNETDIYYGYSILIHLINLIVASASGTLIDYKGEKVPVTNQLIAAHTTDMGLMMKKIISPNIRVELLENIFSLLFLRRSDFKHQPSEDIDSDNVSLDSNLSRNMSRSLDSLSVLDDHMDHLSVSITKNTLYNSEQSFANKSITESLLQEFNESSTDTIKSNDNNSHFPTSTDMSPGFVTTMCIVKEVLSFISDNLLQITSRKNHIHGDSDANDYYSPELEHHVSRITNYTSEAEWRFQFVSGLQSNHVSRGNLLNTFESNTMQRMLGSSEALVYLTMKKKDLVQSKQVIKMYNLKGQPCCEEVDFMEELSVNLEKLKVISLGSKSMESQLTDSPLDKIRSNASAGKISSEVTQIAESLLQHPVIVKGIHNFPMIDTSVCIDLMFSVSLSFSICKSLLDLANLKAEFCDPEEYIPSIIATKLKLIKMFLQFMNNKKYFKIFEWNGQIIPSDFLTLYVMLPSKTSLDTGSLNNKIFLEGKDAFDELREMIDKLHENYKDLVEDKISTEESDLMHKASSLFSVFTSDILAKLNNVPSTYDYMKSLFKYVNKFSKWQLNHKTRNKIDDDEDESEISQPSTTMKAANPFLVFNENISETFGRLLFEWEVTPKKLEGFALHTNIKLIKIIAEKCGVFVASNKNKRRQCMWSMLFQQKSLLNQCDENRENTEVGKSPNVTVETLLNNVLDIRNKIPQLNDTTSEFSEVLNSLAIELSKVDMDELKTHTQKLSFFINLFNLLFLHAFVLIMGDKFDSHLHNAEEILHLLQSSFGRLIFYHNLAYKVGKLGVVTGLDLYRNVIKCESASSFFGIHQEAYESIIPSLKIYDTDNPDCYSCFPVVHEIVDSPFVTITYPATIKSILESTPLNYLEKYIKVNDSKSEVLLSKFIHVHKQCFIRYLTGNDAENVSGVEDSSCGDSDDDERDDGKHDVGDDGYTYNNVAEVDVYNAVNSVADDLVYNDAIDHHGDHNDNYVDSSDNDGDNNDNDEIHSLLTYLSKSASPDFNRKLKHALEKCYTVKVDKQNWFLSNNSLHPGSYLHQNSVIQRTQTFSLMSEEISNYLEDACLLAGTLIELCLLKNQLIKQLTTIFNNNVLYNSVNEKGKKLSVFTSLQDGLARFKTFTRYISLKNLVAESSMLFESVMKSTEYFEFSLPSSLMNKFYSSIQNLLCHKFICTLSPDQWSEIIPVLLECCFHSRHFWKIILSNLELFIPMFSDLFEIVLCHCISEIKDLGVIHDMDSFDLKHTLKRLIMLLNETENKYRSILQCEHLLPIRDVIDLIKICIEDDDLESSRRNMMCTHLKRCEWYEQVFHLNLSHDNDTFQTWHSVKYFAEQETEKMLQLLISSDNYHLINMWCDYFELPENVYEQCLQWKLKNILANENVDYLTLQLTLDKIECNAMCLRICHYLLAENNGYNNRKIFIIQYMTNALWELLDPVERGKLILNKIGILLIEMIPIEIQDSYQCLQNNPLLIVEQLLMNMKVKLVGKALKCIHLETLEEESKAVSTLESECDELVARYAQLALDLSRLKQDSSEMDLLDLPGSESDMRERKWSTASQLSVKKEKDLYSPLQPVHPKKWVKDNDVVSCMLCRDLFNMFNRRHHCRHCGRVTCTACSSYYCYMSRYKRKERTCVKCYNNNYQKPKITENSSDERDNTVLDIPHGDYVFDTPSPHMLTCDTNTNEKMRNSFSYEKAPSASLCLAIVDLRTNHCAAAGLLVKFSKSISQYLHENHEGIDLSIVARMIELVLYHAKLKFLKAGDFDGIELTETYRTQIETVKILVESNWPEIPSMHELSSDLRRLRDQLIENEQFNLAIEVTSKCALDTTINFLMGLSRLKYGDLEKAREYFARCLTTTQVDVGNSFGPNHHYLERIVEQIENSPLIAINHVTKIEEALFPTPIIQAYKNSNGDCILDTRRYEECIFYLKTYGSYNHLINFLVKKRLYKKAISFIRKEKCTPDQFVIYILIPAFQEGCFDLLCNELTSDSNHKFWESYLNHACKYLSKQGMYHCLYELQMVIKDYFRAALTCVRFYLGSVGEPPSTYAQLNLRLRYLNLASSHLENLLKERSNRSSFVSHVGYSFLGEDKLSTNQEIPTSDVKHHLYTIKLQIEVTTFLNTAKPKFDITKLVTLFGNGKERAELVIQILMFGGEDSIPLVSKIIKEFKLPSLPIVCRAIKRIVHYGKYDVATSMIQQIESSGLITFSDRDEILLQAVKVMVTNNQSKYASQFIKLMKSDIFKVNGLIACGHLREAYLEAVKNERYEQIENILDEAKRSNQRNMVDICEKWLRNYIENRKKGMKN